MAGGIQKGTTASTEESIKLDKSLKLAAAKVREELQALYLDIVFEKKLSRKVRDELSCVDKPGEKAYGVEPDGGIFYLFFRGILVPIAAFEGKKQGDAGNAEERWFKNNDRLGDLTDIRALQLGIHPKWSSDDFYYKTWCTGEGAAEGSTFDRLSGVLKCKHRLNKWRNRSIERSVEPFKQEDIEKDMYRTVEQAYLHIKKLLNEDWKVW